MDWTQVIPEIQEKLGLTQAEIASRVGCAQATVSDLANGATRQPGYALGAALVDLLDCGLAHDPNVGLKTNTVNT